MPGMLTTTTATKTIQQSPPIPSTMKKTEIHETMKHARIIKEMNNINVSLIEQSTNIKSADIKCNTNTKLPHLTSNKTNSFTASSTLLLTPKEQEPATNTPPLTPPIPSKTMSCVNSTKLRKRAKIYQTQSHKLKRTTKLLQPVQTKVTKLSNTTVPSKMRYFCRDLKGKKHDIKELRKLRNKAVLKGMKWMKKFLRRNKYAALYDIGDDAPSIFFEIWYTSADSRIRAQAGAIARELLNKLEKKMIKKENGRPPNRDGFFAIMFLARIRNEMGDYIECENLLKRADISYKVNGFKDTDHLFDQTLDGIYNLGTDPWLGLLMNILIMEFNNILFPKRYPIQWGMKEALECIKHLKLDGPGGDDFHCSLFLATHIIYALGAYQSIKTSEKDCPWLYRYLRISMRYWMKQASKLEKQKKHNHAILRDRDTEKLLKAAEMKEEDGGIEGEESSNNGGEISIIQNTIEEEQQASIAPLPKLVKTNLNNKFIYFEIDGVSEIVDTFRGCGLTSASDRLVCEGSLSLLRTQKADGSWPYWTDHGDGSKDKDCSFYDVLHPTWVAVQGLRDRDFKLDRPASEKWRTWINKIVKQIGFADEPTYDGNWFTLGASYNTSTNGSGVINGVVTNNKRKKKKLRKKNKKNITGCRGGIQQQSEKERKNTCV